MAKVKTDPTDDNEAVQIENIYGIPSESEKLQIEAKKMKKEKSKVLAKKKESLVDAFKKFSKTNKDSDFDAAMKIRTDLIENEN